MPREMSVRPKVVTETAKVEAARASAVMRKPVGRETGVVRVIRLRLSA